MFPNRQKLNINGVWLFLHDPQKVGEEKQWYLNPPLDMGVEILFPMKEPLQETTSSSALWFIKEFDIQNIEKDTLLFLHLQNVNFKSVIWLNGNYIGTHEGAFTAFNFNITKYVQKGRNLLIIKVLPFLISAETKITTIYNSTWIQYPGIWGDIHIEFVPQDHIQNVQVKSDIRGKRIVTNVYVKQKNCVIRAKIPKLNISIESNRPKIVIPLDDFITWGPDSPELYTLQVEYITDTLSDFAEVRFGMRDFSANENQFMLNFKPFFMRAFSFYWNLKDLNTPLYSEEKLREFFLKLCKANFNFIVSYGQPLPEKIIRICDEIGIMIAETPSLQYDTNLKRWRELAENEIEELLNKNINNPSLAWLNFEYSSKNFNITNFVHKIRKIDRSRFISFHPSSPYSNHSSYYCIPYHIDLLPMEKIQIKPADYLNQTTQNCLEHIGNKNQLNVVIPDESENTKHNKPETENKYEYYLSKIKEGFIERDLNLTLNSLENLSEQIKEIRISNLHIYVNSLLSNSYIKGYCLHGISEKGIFCPNDYYNPLKVSETQLKNLQQINSSFRLIIALGKTNILQDEETSIHIFLVSHKKEDSFSETENKAILSIHISSPSQQVLWKKRKEIKFKKDVRDLWTGNISGSANIGQHILVAQLSVNNRIVSELTQSLYVFPTPQPSDIPIKFIDTQNHFSKICSPWVKESIESPLIYIVPPIYNSIYSYPETEFFSMLEYVRHGAIGIVFSPPDDWNELSKWFPDCPQHTSLNLNDIEEYNHFHYVKPHPLFLNLPNRCLMKQEYKNIIPSKVFLERGDEDICGCLIIPQDENKEPFWGSDIIVSRYGVGKLVFVHLRVLENIPDDPIATHIFLNMINYFARRAIPSNEDIILSQNILEQFRFQRNKKLRKWMVIGEFPIVDKELEEKLHPNVKSIDFTTSYWGKYGEITWKQYHTNINNHHLLDFHQALSIPLNLHILAQDNGIAYAFAEFNYEDKEEVIIQIETCNAFKLWFNSNEVLENLNSTSQVQIFEAKISMRKWKNSIFIKIIKNKGNHAFILNFYDTKRKKIDISW